MPVGQPKMGRSWWRGLTECGPLEKGRANHFSILMISVRLQGKPFNITVIQVYAPTSNAEEAEFEWFYEDLLEKAMTTHSSTLA